jgi:hypothetical protein
MAPKMEWNNTEHCTKKVTRHFNSSARDTVAKAQPPISFHKEDKKIQRKPSPHLDVTNPGDRPVYKNGCFTIQSSSNLHFLLSNLLLENRSLTPKTFRENCNTEGRKITKLSPKRQSNN